ncbi:MAG: hypothetical protein K8S55_02600 [Phycisphaerae bacterium]|nr:hypothetical protein [Phycisphaerae bacterium]
MAEKMNQDAHEDALAALASGGQPSEAAAEEAFMPTEIDSHIGVNPAIDLGIPEKPKLSSAQAIEAKKTRSAQLKSQHSAQVAHHFRKTAIPLLLTMGGVLVIIGISVLVMMADYKPEYPDDKNLLLENGGLFSGICLFLAVVLIGGAAFFHVEVTRAKQKARRLQEALEAHNNQNNANV